jgi:hypothetical protein
MAERQYDDAEVAAIFKRAAESEHSVLPAPGEGKGLTLAALQDIGREVGIPPEAIATAARSLEQGGRPASRFFLGLTIGVGRTVDFDRPLSDAEWERLVADLRETFDARGTVRYDGPFRQWTNGNLQALLEPTPTGHRLRLQTVKGDTRALMSLGLTVLGGAAAMAIVLGLAGNLGHAGSATGIGVIALMGLGMFTAGAARLPGWARLRKTQIEQVIARLTAAKTLPRDESKTD